MLQSLRNRSSRNRPIRFDNGIGRLVDSHPLIAAPEKFQPAEKRHAAMDHFIDVPVVVLDGRADRDVFRLALKDCACLRQRRAAPPFLDDARIAGTGQRTGTEIRADV